MLPRLRNVSIGYLSALRLRLDHVRAQDLLHVFQRPDVRVSVEGCDAGAGHLDRIVAVTRIGDSVKNAYVGAIADDDDPLGTEGGQAMAKIGLKDCLLYTSDAADDL